MWRSTPNYRGRRPRAAHRPQDSEDSVSTPLEYVKGIYVIWSLTMWGLGGLLL